jgi:hypothetical protein
VAEAASGGAGSVVVDATAGLGVVRTVLGSLAVLAGVAIDGSATWAGVNPGNTAKATSPVEIIAPKERRWGRFSRMIMVNLRSKAFRVWEPMPNAGSGANAGGSNWHTSIND